MSETVNYVDGNLYRALSTRINSSSKLGKSNSALLAKYDLPAFLNFESRLLDTREYRQWLELFAEECVYWVPGHKASQNPCGEASINFDDRRRLTDRIVLIETGLQLAQKPASITCRTLSNIEVWQSNPDELLVRCNLVLWELRASTVSQYVGHQEYILSIAPDEMRIRYKIIHLITADEPQGNNSFII